MKGVRPLIRRSARQSYHDLRRQLPLRRGRLRSRGGRSPRRSICAKAGFLHLIVPRTKFRLLRGADCLTRYTFNTGVAQHTFCKICGMKPFYVPRSNPDGIDVNVRCLDMPAGSLTIEPFDGRNWEANAEGLRHLSSETAKG